MNPRITAITLGVRDVEAARRFYGEGLGCPIAQDSGQFVSFTLGDSSSTLALYAWDALAADAGVPAEGSGFRGLTLSYIADTREEVDEMLARAERAGGRLVKPGQPASWGGYSGHFSDPDGYLWKVASSA